MSTHTKYIVHTYNDSKIALNRFNSLKKLIKKSCEMIKKKSELLESQYPLSLDTLKSISICTAIKESKEIYPVICKSLNSNEKNILDSISYNVNIIKSLNTKKIKKIGKKISNETDRIMNCYFEQDIIIINKSIITSLQKSGYNVSEIQYNKKTLIRGKKKQLSIAVVCDKKGKVDVDMAGFENDGCRKEIKQINANLRKTGLKWKIISENRHNKKEGGILIKSVNKIMDESFNVHHLNCIEINHSNKSPILVKS
ncbi:MAG: hypothetical protein JXC36_03550 [Candidatus Atribacteria bacterium]|nr:hypothetical protein [Candidatus Atribacteria bacterium]